MSEAVLSSGESQSLQRIAGIMIPASCDYDIPGADDRLIFADIIGSLDRDFGDVRDGLAALSTLAGGSFVDLDEAKATSVLERFLTSGSTAASVLGRVILQCYYRDSRVLQSLGLEARPPFPKGHTLEQGDWSLLDVVRSRPKLWRDDREVLR
jgi:hypothetical protein